MEGKYVLKVNFIFKKENIVNILKLLLNINSIEVMYILRL